jgi:hypothetical protein
MEERKKPKPNQKLCFGFCSGFFLSSIALYGGEGRERRAFKYCSSFIFNGKDDR